MLPRGVNLLSTTLVLLALTMRVSLVATLQLGKTTGLGRTSGLARKSTRVFSSPAEQKEPSMDDIISLSKRRGFIFRSSEIYNGFQGFYDYGPLGSELKRNIKERWSQRFIRERDDMTSLDSSIIASPKVWEASGHVSGFSDPMCDCKETKTRYRSDQIFFATVTTVGGNKLYLSVVEDEEAEMRKAAKKILKKMKKEAETEITTTLEELVFTNYMDVSEEEQALIPSPATQTMTLTPSRSFNLMFSTSVGAVVDGSSVAYLRPETAQGIFTNFKACQATTRKKLPFGIAQIGKAFRNEITPRNFIFRSREFEQMEIEYFFRPGDEEVWRPVLNDWFRDCRQWLIDVGVDESRMGVEVHAKDKLAHYALACEDVTFRFPFGEQELMGVAARGQYDLKQHEIASGKSQEYFDDELKEKYVPQVVEPSLGVDRLFLALLCSAYAEDVQGGERRSFLKFAPSIAPVKVAVLPLIKNNEQLMEVAKGLHKKLAKRWNVEFDAAGSIGKRYRRADEIGAPFCITVDFETIEKDNCVTIRDRDSTEQTRVKLEDVVGWLEDEIEDY